MGCWLWFDFGYLVVWVFGFVGAVRLLCGALGLLVVILLMDWFLF